MFEVKQMVIPSFPVPVSTTLLGALSEQGTVMVLLVGTDISSC